LVARRRESSMYAPVLSPPPPAQLHAGTRSSSPASSAENRCVPKTPRCARWFRKFLIWSRVRQCEQGSLSFRRKPESRNRNG